MSNAPDQKVEDVLSSVRRLVSSELPRKPRPKAPDGPGALMLTEAHRIESDRREKPSTRSLEDRIAELEAAVGGQEDDFEPDGSEDQTQHRPSRIVYTRPPSSAEEASARTSSLRLSQIALIETGPANDESEASEEDAPSFRRSSQQPDEAPMAEDVPTVAPVSAEVAAFTNPDDVVQKIEARIVSGRPISEPLQLVEPAPVPEKPAPVRAEAEPGVSPEDADDFDAALSQAVAASISATAYRADAESGDFAARDVLAFDEFSLVDLNGDSSDPQVTAAELLAQDDSGEAAPEARENIARASSPETPEPAEAAAPEAEETPSEAKTVEARPSETDAAEPRPTEDRGDPAEKAAVALAALPDEDAMRLLVARLIRQELAGELGERITRNMRRLVRREIKQALSSKDLT